MFVLPVFSVMNFAHQDRKETKRKSNLKAVSSYGLNAKRKLALSENVLHVAPDATEERKRQRVRFFIPTSQHRTVQSLFNVFDPEGAVVTTWRSFLVLPLAYEGWAGGFRLALGTPQELWLRWLDVASDCLFVFDGFISLNTALKYQEDSVGINPGKMGALNRNRLNIAVAYFQNVFPVMIVPSIFYLCITFMVALDPQPQTQGPNLWLWWISSLPRLVFRVLRLKNYFAAMEMNLNVSVSSLQLVKFALIILMSAHWY